MINAASRWLAAVGEPSLTALVERHGDVAFRASVASLLDCAFGREARAWSDPSFVTGLAGARESRIRRRSIATNALPRSLNP